MRTNVVLLLLLLLLFALNAVQPMPDPDILNFSLLVRLGRPTSVFGHLIARPVSPGPAGNEDERELEGPLLCSC